MLIKQRALVISVIKLHSKRLGFSKTNGITAKVIYAIPFPEEGVSEIGKGANGLGKINAHKSAGAGTLHL